VGNSTSLEEGAKAPFLYCQFMSVFDCKTKGVFMTKKTVSKKAPLKKDKMISFRLNEKQLEAINKNSKKMGFTKTEYLRFLLNGGVVEQSHKKPYPFQKL
jgi:hypothetical protein